MKINRGGPEKVEGILQDVSCDFVTLIVKEEIILIAIKHIKSVNYNALACERAMRATIARKVAIIQVALVHKDNQVEVDNKKGDTKLENVLCCDQIKCLVGETVKVNLRGPESRVGELVSLGKDYLTLQLPHGELVYYQLKHVKSLVKKVKESKCGDCYSSCFCSDEDTF